MSRSAAAPIDPEQRALAAWREHDILRAIHQPDRDAIRATEAARALVLELFRARDPRDLFNACARLGRLFADAGASPSLATVTIDGAALGLHEASVVYDEARVAPARASVAEGYFAAVCEAERGAACRAWEYPACAVRLDDETVAIACGYPADDGESLAAWAATVASRAARDGYRQALLSGPEAAKSELAEALRLMGIELRDRDREASPKRWLRLPWRR